MERRRRRCRPALAAAVLLALAGGAAPGRAAEEAAGDGCGADGGTIPESVAGAEVSEGLEMTLADGRLVRLAGIDPPLATPDAPDLPARARAALEAWLGAGPAGLRAVAAGPDRWGRVAALVVRPGGEAAGAAGALLAAGLARARPEPGLAACFPALLAAEAGARTARRGLWAEARYAVLVPGDAAGLATQAGGLALVEGILHVHEGRGAFYLALGRDRWGFAAVVSRRDAARFARAGLALSDYEGTPVRLRGDLDGRFGPRMRLTEPEAVESLEPGSLVEAPDAKHWTARARPR